MGNEPSAPASAKAMHGLLQSSKDNGCTWAQSKMFHLDDGVLRSQDKSESYAVKGTLVSSDREGHMSIGHGMKTVVKLRVPPGALSSEDDNATSWYLRLKAAAKQRTSYNSTDQNPTSADGSTLILLACAVFHLADGLIAAEYKAPSITPEQTEELEHRKKYSQDQGPQSVMNIMAKLVRCSEKSQEIVGTLEIGHGVAFRYMLHKLKKVLVITCWQQTVAAGTSSDHLDGQAAMELLDSRGTQIIGEIAEPVIKKVFDDHTSDNLPSSEQLSSYIAAEEATAAKSGALTKKLDLKIDSLNHIVADKLIPLAEDRAKQIHANVKEAGRLEDTTHKFKETSSAVKREKQWESCKYNLIIAFVVLLVLACGSAFLYYLLK